MKRKKAGNGKGGRKRYRVEYFRGDVPDENDWRPALPLTDFSFPWEDTPPPATVFRALWNDCRLFFRFDCEDSDLVLGEGSDAMEKVLGSDRVEIFLTPEQELNPYFAFEIDPRGEALAYSGKYYREFAWDWDCDGFEVNGGLTESGYRVAGSFLLETLRALRVWKAGSNEILAGVYRAEFSHPTAGTVHEGWMSWVDPGTAKPDFHVPESFGVFELVPRTG